MKQPRHAPHRIAHQSAPAARPSPRKARPCLIEGLESRVLMSAAHPAVASPAAHLVKGGHASTVALAAPTNFSASVQSPTSVAMSWADGDSLATSMLVLRSGDGNKFTTIAKLAASAVSYVDRSAASFHHYTYEVEEANGASVSPASSGAAVSTPLNAPPAPRAVATGPGSVALTWSSNEPAATGYTILRSTDGVLFSPVATVGKVTRFTDNTVSSGTQYTYQLQATSGSSASAVSGNATVSTPLFAPTALASTFAQATVTLTWTDNDAKAAGYYVQRSADGVTFTQIANLTSASANTFADANVSTGHTYFYRVQAYPGTANAATSSALIVNTPLLAPSGLSATASGASAVQLSWTGNDANAQGYLVYRGVDGVHYTAVAKLTGATTVTYIDRSAVSGVTYDYVVRAYAGSIISDPTAMAAVTMPLAAPATLTAVAAGPTAITLTWPMTDPLATGYAIWRSSDGSTFAPLTTLSSRTTLTFTDSTAASASSYVYDIQATAAANASAMTRSSAVATPLVAPTALALAVNGASISLSWTGNDSAAAGYNILRAADGHPFVQIARLTGAAAVQYTDATSLTGHAYAYEVQAYMGTNTSAVSAPATASVPLAPPTSLAAAVNSATSVGLSWSDNDANASSYAIFRSTDGVHFTAIARVNGATAATYTDAAALSGQNYTYAVQALNGTITSPLSAVATATTPLAAPTSLTATADDPQHVSLSWVNHDALTTGWVILRSTDGVTFNPLAQLSGASPSAYVDGSVSSATAYSYEVQATSANNHSAVTAPASVTTPLIAPTGLTATPGGGGVQLNWANHDANATGINILRTTAGRIYAQIAHLTDPTLGAYVDATALTGHAYSYEVQASNGSILSAASAPASVNVALAAPSALAAANSAAGVSLTWTDNDANALGYTLLRSTDGVHFTALASVTGATATAFTDAHALAATTYTYEVQAVAGAMASAVSNAAAITTPLAAPNSLTATQTGAYVTLAWVNHDATATGYTIYRSTDNVTFSPLSLLLSGSAASFVDTHVSAATTYYYQVQATTTSNASAVSNTATISTPSGAVSNAVTVTTRYGNELVVTATGTSDALSISQSGSTLTILGDGQTFTDSAPAAGLFIYTRGGNDSVVIDASVTARTTVDSIDNANTVINTAGANVSVWDDATDTVIGAATRHAVASFAGGVAKTLGASLANPTDAGTTASHTLSLFGAGPVAADVNQGEVGDCYFLSSLAAFANQRPQTLENAAVDLGDGTYAVEFHSGGNPVFVRVNNSFTTGGFGGYAYAHPGSNNTIWAAVMEKAFCYFRTGANTYNSINSGWMDEVYHDLGVQTTDLTPSALSDNDLFTQLSNDLANGQAITFGTQAAPNLVQYHAYTLISVSQVNGVNYYTVRNPWGSKGDSLENNQGLATLTYAQMRANFVSGTIATT